MASEIVDGGEGFDQPVMENGDLAIFDTGDGYVVRQFGEGDRLEIPGTVTDAFWDQLRVDGWKDVEL